jgi:biopolymer transport protein ExbB
VRARHSIFALLAGLACGAVQAQDPFAGAESLNALLDVVVEERNRDQAEAERLANEYRAAPPAQQQTMLQQARARRDAAQQRADATQEVFAANEEEITEANIRLLQAAEASRVSQIAAMARQAANEAHTILEQSLITSQFAGTSDRSADREEFLDEFANARRLPTTAELERLWYEAQREMTAMGEVASYTAVIAEANGTPRQASIVRIGPFTATTDGNFLTYSPALQTLAMLPRPLPSEFGAMAKEFEQTTSGYSWTVIDPMRGVMLDLYVERPTLIERIELGEWVGYIIIVVGLAGLLMFLFQLVVLVGVRLKLRQQLKNLDAPKANNPLGRVLLAFKGEKSNIEEEADVAELRISEAMLREIPRLERFQAFLRLGVAAGPLLGLIGTVVGMIITFQSITETGSSDPRLMATGIGQAMIATVLGLGIAIPLLFANALLASMSKGVV